MARRTVISDCPVSPIGARRIAIIANQAYSLVNFRGVLIRDLVHEGWTVFALAPDYNDDHLRSMISLGATPMSYSLSRAGINPFRDSVDTIRLAFMLRRLKLDASFAYFIKPVIYGTLAAWLARVPRRLALIEGLGFVFTQDGRTPSLRRRILKKGVGFAYALALSVSDKAIFLNRDDLDEFVAARMIDVERTVCLGGIGVDLEEWAACAPVKNPLTFVMACRLLREKGVLEYVEAAKAVKQQSPQTRFVLLGDVDLNPGSLSRSLVRSWVEDGTLEWPGHVDVKPWLAAASVFVLPSYREGLPRSTQEAMAMGRAVITTDVPGCRDTVTDGVNGFLVPARDVAALRDRMLHFVEHPDAVEVMGRKSREIAEDRFDVRKVNAKLLELIRGPQPAPAAGVPGSAE